MTSKKQKTPLYTQQEAERIAAIGPVLCQWYETHGRPLPWREERDAYRIWISEIMLQQTRIEAVKPYFARFMEALPTMEALAQVPEERLLKLWEGLGYYSRARNLKRCAITVVQQYEGQLPADYEALKKLPGIGPYTAGAIASLAYGLAVPAVDGNVLRVLSRVLRSEEDIMQTGVRRRMERLLLDHMPQDKPGPFNEGIMELGETICLPNGRPLCERCPLREDCRGYAAGVQENLPVKAPKKARRIEKRTVVILRCREQWIALRRRPDRGLLAGLYELPSLEGHLTEEELREALPLLLGASMPQLLSVQPTERARHIFTHVEWDMTGYVVELQTLPQTETCFFVERGQWQKTYALPSAFRAFLPWLD